MTAYVPRQRSALDPLSPDEIPNFSFEDYKVIQDQKKDWQIMPPVVTSGQLAAIQTNNAPLASNRQLARQDAYNIQTPDTATSSREAAPLCRVSFVGPDQQWYSIKIGQGSPGSGQSVQNPPPIQAPAMQAQTVQQTPPWGQQAVQQTPPWGQQAVQTPPWQGQQAVQQTPPWQGQQVLNQAWYENEMPDARMLGKPNIKEAGRPAAAMPKEAEEEETSKDFILQIVQPALTGLMDGSVSTLAPIFSVAFATHSSFTAFLVGLASALGAGISMTFSEALSDDGELTGRGKPFLRGGVTGLMTFLSGLGHALPFLIPNLQIALYTAYAVVAVELVVIAAIRHKFFGTGWLISMVQVVGGGALVFAVALLLGNA